MRAGLCHFFRYPGRALRASRFGKINVALGRFDESVEGNGYSQYEFSHKFLLLKLFKNVQVLEAPVRRRSCSLFERRMALARHQLF
jgi:hypothetical protein